MLDLKALMPNNPNVEDNIFHRNLGMRTVRANKYELPFLEILMRLILLNSDEG